ncbi:MMPL family transporter [Embleya sp. NBC_00888]|uniref:MMPL family transporter n=1 Tax=Embleya sp. NBC_00888 TaxID=2975960 RepID=UPI002F906B64
MRAHDVARVRVPQCERGELGEQRGPAGLGGDACTEPAKVEGGEVVGLVVAAIVLMVTLGSLVAAGLPLLTAFVGAGVGMAGLLALSGSFEVITTAPVLALTVGLAVGIDYALFIVSRHRRHLAEGMPVPEAAARANATAGSAVVFAGLTVVVALAGLAVAGVPFLTAMGLAASAAVVVAVLVAITLLPALLGFAGHRIDRFPVAVPRPRRRPVDRKARPAAGERWARFVVRRPLAVLLAGLAALAALAVPAFAGPMSGTAVGRWCCSGSRASGRRHCSPRSPGGPRPPGCAYRTPSECRRAAGAHHPRLDGPWVCHRPTQGPRTPRMMCGWERRFRLTVAS